VPTGAAEADVRAALATLGLEPRSVIDLGGWRSGRATYRIAVDDDRVLKARRHQGRVRGARAAGWTRAIADPGFPAPIAVVDRVTIEEWIDGTPIAELRLTGGLVDAAADLLGRLHAVESLPDHRLRARRSTIALLARFDRHLADLTDAGLLRPHEEQRLAAVAHRDLPGVSIRGLTHGDFCATNLLATGEDELVCIDNEAIGRGFLDEDLARTWCRWPMPAWAWTRFRARYGTWGRDAADPPVDRAWRAVSATRNAHRWRRARATTTDLPVQALRRVLHEADTADDRG
jgi:hypothetical protein